MNDQTPRTGVQRWADAVLHRGPGYDLTPEPPRFTAAPRDPAVEQAAEERAAQAAAASEESAAWFTSNASRELESLRAEVAAARKYAADLRTARSCRVAAVAAAVAGVLLAVVHEWLAAFLVLWLVPSLLVVAGRAHRAHARRSTGREGAS